MKNLHWILQDFEDMRKLSDILDRNDMSYSYHKVIPFIGELEPSVEIKKDVNYLLFGSYTLWRYAEKYNLMPGVFRISPYVYEDIWKPFLLNYTKHTIFSTIANIPLIIQEFGKGLNQNLELFIRPVEDSKEIAGRVMSFEEIIEMCEKVTSLKPEEYIGGSLNPNTEMMLSCPVKIVKEWRIWVIDDRIVTYSLYKEGYRVIYRNEIDDDALKFAIEMVNINRGYSKAYVLDICRTYNNELFILETNCINAAGFYAADISKIVSGLIDLIS